LVVRVIRPPSFSTTPGTPTTTLSISSAGNAVAATSDERRDAIVSIAVSASAAASSTSCRARISPVRSHAAPRRKRAPRSKPSTNAASGVGSK
jgi:hypothetical protein